MRGLTADQLERLLAAKESKRTAWFAEKRALQDWERASRWLHACEEKEEQLREEFGAYAYGRTRTKRQGQAVGTRREVADSVDAGGLVT